MVILYVIGFIAVLWTTAATFGFGKNEVFNHPESMTDTQLEQTIQLCSRIEDNPAILSKAHQEASRKFLAAMNELTRRHGVPMAPH